MSNIVETVPSHDLTEEIEEEDHAANTNRRVSAVPLKSTIFLESATMAEMKEHIRRISIGQIFFGVLFI